MNMTIANSLLEKKEIMARVRPFPPKEKENNVMIMTITSSLLEKKEMVAMVRPFPLLERGAWSDRSLLKKRRRM